MTKNKANNIIKPPLKYIMSISPKKRIIYACITLFWMCIIFSFSLQPANNSSQMSMGIGKWLVDTFLPWFSEKLEVMQKEQLEFFHFLLRKTGHFTEYFILGLLSMLTMLQTKVRYKRLSATTFCMLAASMDETIQLFVSGRSGQISDVILDSVGAMVGILLISCLFNIIKVDF